MEIIQLENEQLINGDTSSIAMLKDDSYPIQSLCPEDP